LRAAKTLLTEPCVSLRANRWPDSDTIH